jgi:hypothetical protein
MLPILFYLPSGLSIPNASLPPRTHYLFSALTFGLGSSSGALLGERDDGDAMVGDELDVEGSLRIGSDGVKGMSAGTKGGWLESDDIEEC